MQPATDGGAELEGEEPAAEREEVERLESELARERERNESLRAAIDDLAAVVGANADGDLTETPGRPPTDEAASLYDAYRDLLMEWDDTVDRDSGVTTGGTTGTTVEFWHAMGGEKALLLEEFAREFPMLDDRTGVLVAKLGTSPSTRTPSRSCGGRAGSRRTPTTRRRSPS